MKLIPNKLTTIRSKFLAISIPIALVAMVVLFFVFELLAFRLAHRGLHEKLDRLVDSQATILAESVWNVDDERTELILSSLLADPDVAGIAVHDEADDLIHTLGHFPEPIIAEELKHPHGTKIFEPAFLSDIRDLLAAITKVRPHPHHDMVAVHEIIFETDASENLIGHLVVRFTLDNVMAATRNKFVWDGLLAAALVLAVIVGAMIAHGRTVGTPLRRLLNSINRAKENHVLVPVDWQSSDEIGAVVAAFNDLQSSLTEHEAAVQQSHDELEEQVRARTNELEIANDELHQAKDSAEEASRAKSKFLAMMSHEIRTPMNGVLGALGLLNTPSLEGSERRYVAVAQRSAESLLSIINDILDFSKMEAGKLDLEPSVFEVAYVLDDVVEVLAPRAADKGITLRAEINDEMPSFVVGDPVRVQQVLLNLVSNAVKFTEEGGIIIRARTSELSGDTVNIRFEVEDTGVGIAPQDHANLFEEFWAKGQYTTGDLSSTGLGLAICKHLVEMMSGSIGFQSEKSHGSTFWFELPFALPSAETVAQERDRQSSLKTDSAEQPDTMFSGRVLVAEDNSTNQLIVRGMLERLGLQVDVVADGHEAVEAVKAWPYDLVVMDIGMPEMDGIDATTAIRALPGAVAKVPIVAMTAYVMHGDRDRILSKGLDGYVGKPINRQELIQTLARWLPSATNQSVTPATSGVEDVPLYDGAMMESLAENVGAERIGHIIETYLGELTQRLDAITAAHKVSNSDGVAKEAHPLKSSSAEIGALRLSALAAAIEAAARSGNCAAAADIALLQKTADETRMQLMSAGRVLADNTGTDRK